MATAKKSNPNPSANEDKMPKGMGEIARQALEQGAKEAREAKAAPPPASTTPPPVNKKRGGAIKKYVRGGGIESRGKTKGRFV
jgi:hypothetical protein